MADVPSLKENSCDWRSKQNCYFLATKPFGAWRHERTNPNLGKRLPPRSWKAGMTVRQWPKAASISCLVHHKELKKRTGKNGVSSVVCERISEACMSTNTSTLPEPIVLGVNRANSSLPTNREGFLQNSDFA